MRAHERALVTLNALIHIPFGHFYGNAAFFEFRGSRRHRAVRIERRRRKFVAFEREDGSNHVAEIFVIRKFHHFRAFCGGSPRSGDFDFHKVGFRGIDGVVVHLNDRVALAGERLVRHVLHQRNGGVLVVGVLAFVRHDLLVDAEERGLQNRGRFAAETELTGDFDGVDHIQIRVLFRQRVFHLGGQFFFKQFEGCPLAVQKERAAVFQVAYHIVTGNVRRVVARDEVRRVD